MSFIVGDQVDVPRIDLLMSDISGGFAPPILCNMSHFHGNEGSIREFIYSG